MDLVSVNSKNEVNKGTQIRISQWFKDSSSSQRSQDGDEQVQLPNHFVHGIEIRGSPF